MRDYIENCPYCTGKAVQEGTLDPYWEMETVSSDGTKFTFDIEGYFKVATPVMDNHGIFVFYSCDDCDKEQRDKYDPIIFNDYDAYFLSRDKAQGGAK